MAVYLDYNASAPMDERVLARMVDIYTNHFGNADSRTHVFGTDTKEIVANSRRVIADVLSVDPMDLFFTGGSTESNNMAILGMLEFAQASGRNHFITTSIEHKSVLEAMHYLEKHGCNVDYVSPDSSGRVDPNNVLQLVNEKTLLVSMMYVNSETGIIQPVEEVGNALRSKDVYFHVDATQALGKLNEGIRKTSYDMLSITAHKIGGPQGIGGLVLKRDAKYRRPPVTPLMFGGQQERGYRPGTTPVALVAGFATATEICEAEEAQNMTACIKTKQKLLNAIKDLKYCINGDPSFCIPSTINISFKGVDAEALFVALKDDYAFSNGSACNSGSHKPSYVLNSMGLSEDRIAEAIRLSWGSKTDVDFDRLVEFVKASVM